MSMFFTQPNLTANGNIRGNRFLTGVSGNGNFRLAVEATASTQLLLGVSESGERGPAMFSDGGTYLAIAGDSIPYRGPLQFAALKLGGTVSNANVPLTSDSSGRGVAQAPSDGTTTYYGAIALEAGVEDDVIEVYVLPSMATV